VGTTHAFERYKSGASLIHRLDPRVKLAATLLVILSNLLLPDGAWLGFALSWGLILLVTQLTGLGQGYVLRRSLVALPFALAASTIIFTLPGNPLLNIPLGPWRLTVSDAGLLRFTSIVLRSWLAVQAAIILTATTAFPDLLHAMRHLRIPALLVMIVGFMYRYLFVLGDETQRLLRAREARSASTPGRRPGGTLAWRARVAGNMAGQLFLRGYERSDRVYNAMLARGYQGQMLTLNPHVMRPIDFYALAATLAALGLVQLLARL
jgi:cobalt/nickel transport system permease protein